MKNARTLAGAALLALVALPPFAFAQDAIKLLTVHVVDKGKPLYDEKKEG